MPGLTLICRTRSFNPSWAGVQAKDAYRPGSKSREQRVADLTPSRPLRLCPTVESWPIPQGPTDSTALPGARSSRLSNLASETAAWKIAAAIEAPVAPVARDEKAFAACRTDFAASS